MHHLGVNSEIATNPTRSWTRLDGVDLLRALAIFFVLMNHVDVRLRLAHVPYTAGWPLQLVNSLIFNAEFGVQMFFAVSGFLITSTSLRRWGSLAQVSVRDFYLLRIARIAPLLLSLLAILSILQFAHVKDFVVPAQRGGFGRALFAALTFRVNLSEARHGYLPGNWDVLWSLSIEETFYLFFPVICFLFGRGKLLVVILLTFVALGPFGRTVFSHGNPLWQQRSYLGGMDAIALGCLTAIFLAHRQLSRAALWTMGTVGIGLLTFILGFSVQAYRWGIGRTGLDMTIIALGTCMVVAVAAQTKWRSPRALAPFLLLGQRSYEIYLMHAFIVFGLLHLFYAAGKPMWAVPAYFAGVILLASLLGEVVARFYSEPMNRWLRNRWGDGPEKLGTAIGSAAATLPSENHIAL
jgi:peptidoglycan/LPS O-acetylase OafA/YrhL